MRFVDHLRSCSADGLAELLTARPDLLPASDRGFEALARAAAASHSIGRVLLHADIAMLVVADALVVASPTTADDINELLGADDLEAVLAAVDRLHRRGVVVIDDGMISLVTPLGDLCHRPLGLGPSFAELVQHVPESTVEDLAHRLGVAGTSSPPGRAKAIGRRLARPQGLAAVMADAPDSARELILAMARDLVTSIGLTSGVLYRPPESREPTTWLIERGVLVTARPGRAELPREIILAANNSSLDLRPTLRPIPVENVSGLPADAVAAAAADQAARFLEGAESLMRLAADGEIAVRRRRDVGVRELRRLAKVIEFEPRDVGRLIEILHDARLVVATNSGLEATDLASSWWKLDRARRWLVLVRAWYASASIPSVVLSDWWDGKPLAALARIEPLAMATAGREVIVGLAAQVADGHAFDREQLIEAVMWRAPNLWGIGDPTELTLVRWTIDEAGFIGLLAHDAPTAALRALAGEQHHELEEAAAGMLGLDQEQFVLQNDLTAVALGPLDPMVSGRLADMAERQAGVSVPSFRFTESTVRDAFDRGWRAATIEAFLAEYAVSGVPQPLSYLLADVERRYGSVKVHDARSIIVTDDEALAVEIASSARAQRLRLRRVGPTVLVADDVDPEQLLEELRAEGHFPVLSTDTDTADTAESGDLRTDEPPARHAHDSPGSPDDAGLPADWTGPSLPAAALAGEVADAVSALQEHGDADRRDPSVMFRLLELRDRPAVLSVRRDGGTVELRGVPVDVAGAVTLLTEDGIEEFPLDDVVSADDPGR